MKKEDCEMMIQPYLMRECEDYHQVVINNYGISHFYELTTGENPYEDVKAVPDGCVDLFFCWIKIRFILASEGQYFRQKNGR